jgi:hypothetical protein
MNTLETVIEQVINPSAKDMRILKEAIMANPELASLFNGIPHKAIIEKTGTVKVPKALSVAVDRKPRAAPQPKADEVRCQAVVWNLEKDAETGELKPKRCTRGCDAGSTFCKQHGLPDGKKCAGCSAYFGEDVVHQFKHEHMGTIHEPSYIFEKYRKDVEKIYQNSLLTPEVKATAEAVEPKKKVAKKSSKKTETDEHKPKRALNPYMKYLQENREAIKAAVLEENADLKGKELQNAITKRAGEIWKALKASGATVEATVETTVEDEPVVAEEPVIEEETAEEAADDEDDKMNLTYNDELKVWIDEDTQLYYDDEQGTDAKGSVVGGVLKPFKARK